jgi:hypothetical protein
VQLYKVLEVMSTNMTTGLNPFNFIRKHFLQICVRKVAVHLYKVLEVMSTNVYTGLNPFNFIHKHFLQICVWKVIVHLHKVLEVMPTGVYTRPEPVAKAHSDLPNALYEKLSLLLASLIFYFFNYYIIHVNITDVMKIEILYFERCWSW